MHVTLCLSVVISVFVSVQGFGEPLLGPGIWLIENVMLCDEAEQYEWSIDATRRKLNRTHDCFAIHFHFPKPLSYDYGILVDVYKKVDGGYRYIQKFVDDSACAFIMRYARGNVETALSLGGIDPPDCPMPQGDTYIKDFVFDYSEINELGLYGSFEVHSYITSHGKKLSCMKIFLKFEKKTDDDGNKFWLF